MPDSTTRKSLYLLVGLQLTQPLHGGVWGDVWGSLIWGPRPPEGVAEGLILYAPTVEMGAAVSSCFDLLAHLGGPGVVESVVSVVSATQQTRECSYTGAAPAGVDFPVVLGIGYLVKLQQPVGLVVGTPLGCPATVLDTGVNLVGIGLPPEGLTCFGVLNAFGAGVVTTVERLDSESRRFESCAATGANPTGDDFRIEAGDGYFIHAQEVSSGVNLNDAAHPVCAN